MPFINVKTNAKVPAAQAETIKSGLGQAISTIPGKSEGWLMVGIEGEQQLWFKGSDAPAAMVSVSIYGSAQANALSALTGKITALLTDTLGIPADRIYVAYASTPNWGWNGANF